MKTASLAPMESTAASDQTSGTASVSPWSRGGPERQFRDAIVVRRRILSVGASTMLVVAILALTACSSDSGKSGEPAKPVAKGPELITARSAFQKLYVAARGWNQDAKPYRIESMATSDGNGHDGRWAIWRGSFASASHRSGKAYTWSGSAAEGAPERGVNPGI